MKLGFISRAAEFKRLVKKNLQEVPSCENLDHDRTSRFEPICTPEEYELVVRAPPTTTDAKLLFSENYSKLWPHRLWPYRLITEPPNYLMITQDGTASTLRNNQISGNTPSDGRAATTQPGGSEHWQSWKNISPYPEHNNPLRRNNFDRFIRPIDTVTPLLELTTLSAGTSRAKTAIPSSPLEL